MFSRHLVTLPLPPRPRVRKQQTAEEEAEEEKDWAEDQYFRKASAFAIASLLVWFVVVDWIQTAASWD